MSSLLVQTKVSNRQDQVSGKKVKLDRSVWESFYGRELGLKKIG